MAGGRISKRTTGVNVSLSDKPVIRYWLYLTLSVLAVKIALLIPDHQPMFLIGDSAAYLSSALKGYIPGDRSFAYGYLFIRAILYTFGSLKAVVVAQSLVSALSSLLLAVILCTGFGAPPRIAASAALLYSVEPLALFQERIILTECTALAVFAVFVLAGVRYLGRPSLWLIALLAALSTSLIALRTSFLPTVFGSMVALPLLGRLSSGPPSGRTGWSVARRALHICVAILLTLSCHALYKQWYHSLSGGPAVYNTEDGFFLLASWAPLLTRADFPDPVVYDRVIPNVGQPIRDRFARPGQRFVSDGLIEQIIRSRPDEQSANDFARQTALNILRRDPVGVIKLGWRTYRDFWIPRVNANELKVEEGLKELDQPLIDLFRSQFKEDLAGHHLLVTPTKVWHAAATPWYLFLLLAPAVWLLTLVAHLSYWREMLFLGICTLAILATDCLVVTEPVVRYLHSIAWLTILFLALLGARALRMLPK